MLHIKNPLVNYPVTDPSAHVFGSRLYVYGGSDAFLDPELSARERLDPALHMQNYHVFSTADAESLANWTDHGEILNVRDVPWAASHLWAPDAACRDGRFYFYFPATPVGSKWGRVGVATAEMPQGPYKVMPQPIDGLQGGEPCVFHDPASGAHFIYFKPHAPQFEPPALPAVHVARLADNMVELAEEPRPVELRGYHDGIRFFEGPWVHHANGRYYLSYPACRDGVFGPEHMAYSTADSVYGPFDFRRIVMPHDDPLEPTNHGSIVKFGGRWLFFYHRKSLPDGRPGSGRFMCCREMSYEANGNIRPLSHA